MSLLPFEGFTRNRLHGGPVSSALDGPAASSSFVSSTNMYALISSQLYSSINVYYTIKQTRIHTTIRVKTYILSL